MTDGGGNNTGVLTREYRKGNWTVGETMVLIEAKKMDEERRMKRVSESEGGGRRSKPTELRWKWVEDYCWRKGCLRSQNQCNDKWDNLMRDYKKVREYERSRRRRRSTGERSPSSCEEGGSGGGGGGSSDQVSYWNLEKNERKERNLPTNMLPQIYEALVEVVESRSGSTSQRMLDIGGGGSGPNPYVSDVVVVERPISTGVVHHLQQSSPLLMPPLLQPHHQLVVSPPPVAAVLPLPPPQPQPPPPPPPPPYSQPQFPTLDSDTSEHSDSTVKRRRRSSSGRGGGGEGASGGGGGSASQSHDDDGNDEKVGTAISKSASIIAEAIQASEEREERRHRDLLSLQERRLKIEESKAEINRQGISGLVDAINKLANSILALASHNNTPQ